MNLSEIQGKILKDNGFSSPEELGVYRDYTPKRLGCNPEDRFVIRVEEEAAAHCEYMFLDLLMEAAHGPAGKEWKMVFQRVTEKWEMEPDGKTRCPYFIDELTVQLPGRPEEKYYFDVAAWFLSIDRFLPGGEFYEEVPEADAEGLRETKE